MPNGPVEVRFGSAIGDDDLIAKLVRLERKLEDVGADPVSVDRRVDGRGHRS